MYGRNPAIFLTPEHEALRESVARLARERIAPRAAEVDAQAVYPHDVFALLKEQGIIGMTIPSRYGGADATLFELCIVIEELAKVCTTAAIMPMATNVVAQMLLAAAKPEQRERYLASLARGEIRFSNAVTEPDAGSDTSAMKTRAELHGDRYVINGSKCFITGAGLSDYYIVFAKVPMEGGRRGITGFIVPRETPGVTTGRIEHKMGIRGMPTGELVFSDCEVPATAMLGAPGEGQKLMLSSMAKNRPAVGARGVGLAQGALDVALAYVKERKAFGATLFDLQAIQFKLADMAMEIEAARTLVHQGASLLDAGHDARVVSGLLSAGKCFATDVAMRVSTEAVQLLGAYGYSTDFPVERLMRDAKHLQIVDGSNEIQRVLIARALAD